MLVCLHVYIQFCDLTINLYIILFIASSEGPATTDAALAALAAEAGLLDPPLESMSSPFLEEEGILTASKQASSVLDKQEDLVTSAGQNIFSEIMKSESTVSNIGSSSMDIDQTEDGISKGVHNALVQEPNMEANLIDEAKLCKVEKGLSNSISDISFCNTISTNSDSVLPISMDNVKSKLDAGSAEISEKSVSKAFCASSNNTEAISERNDHMDETTNGDILRLSDGVGGLGDKETVQCKIDGGIKSELQMTNYGDSGKLSESNKEVDSDALSTLASAALGCKQAPTNGTQPDQTDPKAFVS